MRTKQKIGKKFVNVVRPRTIAASVGRSPLVTALVKEDNKTLTENLAPTFRSTLNALLDLFAMGGAIRSRSDDEVIQLFVKAFNEDRLLATKLLFHIRNIRGGAGERKVFRTILKWLGNNYPWLIHKNLENIPHFGRFDDLFVLFETRVHEGILLWIERQLDEDVRNYELNKPISLLAKWLPSENTSSAATRAMGAKIRQHLEWTPKQYRKTLTVLRGYIDIVESKMSAQEWPTINYDKLPSKASLNYRKAFYKHDAERYQAFIDAVKSGEKKINAGALFPYEIIEKIIAGEDSEVMDILWDALPDYAEGDTSNRLVVADCSGSMARPYNSTDRPMATAIALAIYTAEKNRGKFGGHFMTFSGSPTLQRIIGNNIREKCMSVRKHAHVNTDLQRVFRVLLDAALENNIPQKEMPAQVIVVTDMEFDRPQMGTKTNVEGIEDQYKQAGYKMPQLVFWNCNSRQNNVPCEADKRGILLVSGASPSVFKTLLSGKHYTPVDQMLETLNQKMYDRVVI